MRSPRKMPVRLISLLLLAVFLTAGAGAAGYTDSTGAVFTLKTAPVRTAVLFSSFADMWLSAGGEIAVTVGETAERGFADAGTPLVDAGAGKHVDIERLIALEPDLVIGSADIDAHIRAAEVLRAAGIPTALFRAENLREYLDVLKTMTDVTGRSDLYTAAAERLTGRIARLVAEAPGNGRTFLMIRAGGTVFRYKRSDEHFAAEMLTELGCRNIMDPFADVSDTFSTEYILTADPDFIFVSLMGDEASAKANAETVLAGMPWNALTAARAERVFFLPKELFHFKPNLRWDEAYEYLAGCLAADGI